MSRLAGIWSARVRVTAAPARQAADAQSKTPTTASPWCSPSYTDAICASRWSASTSVPSLTTSSTSRAGIWNASATSMSSASCTPCSIAPRAVWGWRRRDEHAARRQLRLLHLQRLSPARRGLRRGADRRPQRHGLLARALALGLRRDRAITGSGPPRALARLRGLLGHPALQRDSGARHLPRASGARQRARRSGLQRADGDAWTPQPGPASRRRTVRRHSAGLLGRALPLARGHRPTRVRGPRDRLDRRRRCDGDRAPQPPALGGAVPS